VAGDAPSPSRASRTRVYSVVLVVVTATVVTLAVILPVIYNRNPLPPSPPSTGTNVQVDDYAAGSSWAGEFGDDPAVAVAPNGTIAVAWEGLYEVSPPVTPGGAPNFTTAIFVSYSTDGGQHYSTPRYVDAPGTLSAFLPSLAFASNGTLFLAYGNATNTDNQAIIVASAAPGQNFTAGVVAERGQDLGRTWLAVLPNGGLFLAFQYSGFTEWASSTDGGRIFGAPTILILGTFTGGTLWDGYEVTLVGLTSVASSTNTVAVWSETFNATGVGTHVMGTGATFGLSYGTDVLLPNLSRPGPTVTFSDGGLYLFFSIGNETELAMQTSSTNGSTWAGPYAIWTPHDTTIETPVAEGTATGVELALAWESTQGGFWKTYSAMYDTRTGLLSSPAVVSSADGFPAVVRNWHGTGMGFATAGSSHLVVAWGDGRGLGGTYGLTHIYACTLTASF
jgi:hypothetical protein